MHCGQTLFPREGAKCLNIGCEKCKTYPEELPLCYAEGETICESCGKRHCHPLMQFADLMTAREVTLWVYPPPVVIVLAVGYIWTVLSVGISKSTHFPVLSIPETILCCIFVVLLTRDFSNILRAGFHFDAKGVHTQKFLKMNFYPWHEIVMIRETESGCELNVRNNKCIVLERLDLSLYDRLIIIEGFFPEAIAHGVRVERFEND